MSSTRTPAAPDEAAASRAAARRARWLWWEARIEWAFIWFSLYVYSFGPMYWRWYDAKYLSGPPLLAAFYEPLLILGGIVPGFESWLRWYVDLWMG